MFLIVLTSAVCCKVKVKVQVHATASLQRMLDKMHCENDLENLFSNFYA